MNSAGRLGGSTRSVLSRQGTRLVAPCRGSTPTSLWGVHIRVASDLVHQAIRLQAPVGESISALPEVQDLVESSDDVLIYTVPMPHVASSIRQHTFLSHSPVHFIKAKKPTFFFRKNIKELGRILNVSYAFLTQCVSNREPTITGRLSQNVHNTN